MRRALPVLALTALSCVPVPLGAPASAGAPASLPSIAPMADDKDTWKDGKLELLSSSMPSFLPGQQGWVGLDWTATTDVCDIAVTATAPGVTITYPTNTASYSSLYTSDSLAATNRDYTAFRVSVAPSTTGATTVTLRASYTKIPPGQVSKSDDLEVKDVACKGGQKVTETSTVSLPVGSPSGARAVLETTTATVDSGSPTWVPLSFTTQYAGLDNFRVRLDPPSGLEVVYPGDGTSSGLSQQSALGVGTSDAASVRLEATSLSAGTYTVPVTATWSGGSLETELTVTVQ